MKVPSILLPLLSILLPLAACHRETPRGEDESQPVTFAPQVDAYQASGRREDSPDKMGIKKLTGIPDLYLHAYASDWPETPTTRSAPVTSVHNTFSVSGYAFPGAWNDQDKPNLFCQAAMTRNGSSWTGETRMVWPGADYNVRFAAVSPSTATGLQWLSAATDGGLPQISFTVPNTAAAQTDLLECVSVDFPGDGSSALNGVPLTFSHALTAVTFKVHDFGTDGTVKSVTLSGIKDSGRHILGSNVWTNASGNATYTFPNLDIAFSASGETSITTGANTLLLLPQTLAADAQLSVEMTFQGKDQTLTAALDGQVWEPGKHITYTVTPSNDDWLFSIIDITGVPESVSSGIATNVATVKSYREHALGFKQAIPWTLSYSTDGGSTYSATRPYWITSISPDSGDGSITGVPINATAIQTGDAEYRCTVKVSNSGDWKTFDIVIPAVPVYSGSWTENGTGTFAGLHIAPAPLSYNGTTFEIRDEDVANSNTGSWKDIKGKNAGSYYFSFIDLGSFFDSDGNSFSTASGAIDNAHKLSYGGYSTWRVPTRAEWASITTGTTRSGSSVNGTASCRYAVIELTGVTHAKNTYPVGLLLIPDDLTLTGMGRTFNWNTGSTTGNTGVTLSELQAYLDQGCVFLPASGQYKNGGSVWSQAGYSGMYWSANHSSSSNGYILQFSGSAVSANADLPRSTSYLPVRLVR